MAQEDVGVSFVSSLAQITGADLAASVDPAGSVMRGGKKGTMPGHESPETADPPSFNA